jgi:hypothetical protein
MTGKKTGLMHKRGMASGPLKGEKHTPFFSYYRIEICFCPPVGPDMIHSFP